MIARANDNCFEKVEGTEETQESERIVPQFVASRTTEPDTYIWGMMPDEGQPFFVRDEHVEQILFDGSKFHPDMPLHYNDKRHRDLDAVQFLSTEPPECNIAEHGNYYRHVAANPTNHVDPSGL